VSVFPWEAWFTGLGPGSQPRQLGFHLEHQSVAAADVVVAAHAEIRQLLETSACQPTLLQLSNP